MSPSSEVLSLQIRRQNTPISNIKHVYVIILSFESVHTGKANDTLKGQSHEKVGEILVWGVILYPN
jgi:hypothetical protein